ncbi:MAG: NADH-quinone oxidoreductase subunit NuoG [Acidobacteria bacterium]|nr:NADH-quinone oxidoreductase subunit NuoG [Acidobacteriota bacterium]MBI3473053.1 NADH-quinone oxidoreductase subunit NuoG [Candidatus Solibacter usitatus]
MADPVKLTIDGRQIQAPPGTLVIDAAKRAGIEIPAFCYYEGLSLQAACRMCLVEVEKAPKLMASCTLPVAEGMVVRTETPQVAQARKATLEFLLTNHPLDCPVCDKGGECELQDMVFRYGAGESRFTEVKHHVEEKQWSPVVFYDAPRCILCFRCVRICTEGMGVGALGIVNRGVLSEIAPNHGDHLECDECGMCIDICPVGALTSGAYRYKTRPWEMEHAGTICTHCSNGCKVTLGVRNHEIVRGNNRDHSGINGEFLCIKGRYAFDFFGHPERLQSPLMRIDGKLQEVPWSRALAAVAAKFQEVKGRGGKFGVIGSTRTTNEENYYLQKLARQGLGTNHIDHHRSGDLVTLIDALSGRPNASLATTADLYNAKAVLVVAADLASEQPFLSFQVRANYRHHQARIYVVTEKAVREDAYAAAVVRGGVDGVESLRERLAREPELAILFGASVKGEELRKLVEFGSSLSIPVKYVCLLDYSNSRGAIDMGLMPELLPGCRPSEQPGMTIPEMLACADLDVLWVIGANPLARGQLASANAFAVVQEMFLTETALAAQVVLPASSAYEKTGTVTNVTGEVQRLASPLRKMGTKPDLEIIGLIAKEMGLAPLMGPWDAGKVFDQIRQTAPGYNLPLPAIASGGAAQTAALNGRVAAPSRPELIQSAANGLFESGTLGRYSKILHSVLEGRGRT